MSKTLFWYIFGNLLRVFLMTTASLAGIMCFAGLLRPLTENGLNMGQVNRMLVYMMPAMCTYSLPIAALFAATVVYGRFAADNELTAMRAGGISYLSPRRFAIALPALVLGLLVAMVSLLMLSFVVPRFSLKVQEVIYSNIARVLESKITREHSVNLASADGSGHIDLFAQAAQLQAPDPEQPRVQRLELVGPVMTTQQTPDPAHPEIKCPREFYMAKSAMLVITRRDDGSAVMRVELVDGIKFPRLFFGNVQAGVASTTFGPREIPSPINENVKFMTVSSLKELAADPSRSKNVQDILRGFIRHDQQKQFLEQIALALNRSGNYIFGVDSASSDEFQIGVSGADAGISGDELIVTSPPSGSRRPAWLRQTHGSQVTLLAEAHEMRVRAVPDEQDPDHPRMAVSVEMYGVRIESEDGAPQETVDRLAPFMRSFSVPMPLATAALANKTMTEYELDASDPADDVAALRHEELVVNNSVISELHGRASFALSCLTLVMVGCALGILFRSGNFLNAFAVSFVPALCCITLIICGQQIATRVPAAVNGIQRDTLHTGLGFIWIGNVLVLGTAIYLTAKLQRR